MSDSQDLPMLSHANTDTGATSSMSIADHLAAHCQEAGPNGAPNRVERILQFAAAGAWTDAALALLELEQPEWKLRRLVHEDGEWICSLTLRPDLPIELDDVAEAHNALLTLAILDALQGAREKGAPAWGKQAAGASSARAPCAVIPVCDNFG
jgi:hypothetical protein